MQDYANNQPQVVDDRLSLENWVTVGYFNLKDYQQRLAACSANVDYRPGKQRNKRNRLRAMPPLTEAAVTLSEIYLKAKQDR